MLAVNLKKFRAGKTPMTVPSGNLCWRADWWPGSGAGGRTGGLAHEDLLAVSSSSADRGSG